MPCLRKIINFDIMKPEEKIHIAIIEKHPVLLQTLKLILERINNFSIVYYSQNSLGFSSNQIDVLIINELELQTLSKQQSFQNIHVICLSTEYKKITIKDNIIFLNQACELDELIQTINRFTKKTSPSNNER